MNRWRKDLMVVVPIVVTLGAWIFWNAGQRETVLAQEKNKMEPTDEVLQPLEELAKSYNARDAKAFAAVWTENAEYTDEDTGEMIEGRKAIVDDFAGIFAKGEGIRLEIDVEKSRRLGAAAASVEGTARVIHPKKTPARTKFLALLIKQDGKWLIDNVREKRLESDSFAPDKLEALAWMNGVWKQKEGDSEVTVECVEVANGNFRSHRFQVKSKGEIVGEGTQIIGWDPANQTLRSWVFSGDGSFGEATVEGDGDRWIFRVAGTLPTGESSSATQVITRKDKDLYTFRSTDRTVETRVLPDIAEITLTRVANPSKEK